MAERTEIGSSGEQQEAGSFQRAFLKLKLAGHASVAFSKSQRKWDHNHSFECIYLKTEAGMLFPKAGAETVQICLIW